MEIPAAHLDEGHVLHFLHLKCRLQVWGIPSVPTSAISKGGYDISNYPTSPHLDAVLAQELFLQDELQCGDDLSQHNHDVTKQGPGGSGAAALALPQGPAGLLCVAV